MTRKPSTRESLSSAKRSTHDPFVQELKFHHVGVVVGAIATQASLYVERFGYELRSEIIHDPRQTAYVQFLAFPGQDVYLELIAPDGPESLLANALAKGGGLNHVCYSSPDLETTCKELRGRGLFLVRRPTEAVAFDGRRVAWMMGQDHVLVELVERPTKGCAQAGTPRIR